MLLRDDETYEDESGGNSDLVGCKMFPAISEEGKLLFEMECKSIALFGRRLPLFVNATV